MWITRFLLPACVLVAALLAWLAPRRDKAAPTVPARELLELIQREGGRNCSFDRSTSAALAAREVPRPAAGASLEQLEAELSAAGFRLRSVGTSERRHYLVEAVGSPGRDSAQAGS